MSDPKKPKSNPMTTTNNQLPPLPKTPAERLADVFTTAKAVVAHCDTAPGKANERFAYSVDKLLILELKKALAAMDRVTDAARKIEGKKRGKRI